MKNILRGIAISLLALSGPAVASHHRDHAVIHLNEAILRLEQSITFARLYGEQDAQTKADRDRADKYVLYATKYLDRLIEARDLLLSDGDLREIRRLMNAPGFGDERESALWGISQVQGIVVTLINPDSVNLTRVRKILSLNIKSAGSANYALWHINDAIAEELFGEVL